MLFLFVVSGYAQFSFTSKAGDRFQVADAPDRSEPRGGGFVMEFYFRVEKANLVVYEVPKDKGETTSIAVIVFPIDSIKTQSFTVRKALSGVGCYLQTGRQYTKKSYGAEYDSTETYTGDNLELNFKDCGAAESFRRKVIGGFSAEKQDEEFDKALADLDLSLEDKPKQKPKNNMPAHLFALLGGGGGKKTYQLNRKSNEVWDFSTNNVFKVGKLQQSGEEFLMLNQDEQIFVYALKPLASTGSYRLFNGDRATVFSLLNDVICKSVGGGQCETAYRISIDDGMVYKVVANKNYTAYELRGNASVEEIALMVALLDGLR